MDKEDEELLESFRKAFAVGKRCLTKRKYSSEEWASSASYKYLKKYPDSPKQEPYCCPFCNKWHLSTPKRRRKKGK